MLAKRLFGYDARASARPRACGMSTRAGRGAHPEVRTTCLTQIAHTPGILAGRSFPTPAGYTRRMHGSVG